MQALLAPLRELPNAWAQRTVKGRGWLPATRYF